MSKKWQLSPNYKFFFLKKKSTIVQVEWMRIEAEQTIIEALKYSPPASIGRKKKSPNYL